MSDATITFNNSAWAVGAALFTIYGLLLVWRTFAGLVRGGF